MDYAGWIFAAVGWSFGALACCWVIYVQKLHRMDREIADRGIRIALTLTNLRNNCFITNEKGHRVRYWNASAERRAKAEG